MCVSLSGERGFTYIQVCVFMSLKLQHPAPARQLVAFSGQRSRLLLALADQVGLLVVGETILYREVDFPRLAKLSPN